MSRTQRAREEWRRHVWTPEYLSFVLPLTPDQVLQPASRGELGCTIESRLELRWVQLAQRLTWQYGFTGALQRLNAYAA
ncbi:hypothetical protein [Phenylobacterium sp.]|uniref:hypothetical protein n=1 Tax=Phenylobacterium sp. TaxID=1871053 RepID=UPI002DE7C2E1|nr:hypothetical protein [Phenylobacterium sp.]